MDIRRSNRVHEDWNRRISIEPTEYAEHRLRKSMIDGHVIGHGKVDAVFAHVLDESCRERLRHIELAGKATYIRNSGRREARAKRRHHTKEESVVVIRAEHDH